jgi:hypothetical protein
VEQSPATWMVSAIPRQKLCPRQISTSVVSIRIPPIRTSLLCVNSKLWYTCQTNIPHKIFEYRFVLHSYSTTHFFYNWTELLKCDKVSPPL